MRSKPAMKGEVKKKQFIKVFEMFVIVMLWFKPLCQIYTQINFDVIHLLYCKRLWFHDFV